jgi:hypothetical protein
MYICLDINTGKRAIGVRVGYLVVTPLQPLQPAHVTLLNIQKAGVGIEFRGSNSMLRMREQIPIKSSVSVSLGPRRAAYLLLSMLQVCLPTETSIVCFCVRA